MWLIVWGSEKCTVKFSNSIQMEIALQGPKTQGETKGFREESKEAEPEGAAPGNRLAGFYGPLL